MTPMERYGDAVSAIYAKNEAFGAEDIADLIAHHVAVELKAVAIRLEQEAERHSDPTAPHHYNIDMSNAYEFAADIVRFSISEPSGE